MKKTIMDILQDMDRETEGGLTFQVLGQCLDGQQKAMTKPPGTRFTFVTSESLADVVVLGKRDAVIIWVDKEDLIKRVNANKGRKDG